MMCWSRLAVMMVVVLGCASAYAEGMSLAPAEQRGSVSDFELKDISGAGVRLSDFRGKAVVVSFWATWCEPCRKEIPLLAATQALHRESLAIVGIAVDELEPVIRFEDEVGINYVSLVGKNEALTLMARYGNSGQLPFTLVFDRAGRLRYTKTGEVRSQDIASWLSELP